MTADLRAGEWCHGLIRLEDTRLSKVKLILFSFSLLLSLLPPFFPSFFSPSLLSLFFYSCLLSLTSGHGRPQHCEPLGGGCGTQLGRTPLSVHVGPAEGWPESPQTVLSVQNCDLPHLGSLTALLNKSQAFPLFPMSQLRPCFFWNGLAWLLLLFSSFYPKLPFQSGCEISRVILNQEDHPASPGKQGGTFYSHSERDSEPSVTGILVVHSPTPSASPVKTRSFKLSPPSPRQICEGATRDEELFPILCSHFGY